MSSQTKAYEVKGRAAAWDGLVEGKRVWLASGVEVWGCSVCCVELRPDPFVDLIKQQQQVLVVEARVLREALARLVEAQGSHAEVLVNHRQQMHIGKQPLLQ